ncbi:MAG TPA: cellulase family glycosylhydrolase [Roseiflexaceae bacterium]|nr:cellulase family glycosylhydrolase [Roseiflexaceae bacterium]
MSDTPIGPREQTRLRRSLPLSILAILLMLASFNNAFAQSTLSCRVTYTVINQWADGFQADVKINNTGTSPINSWTLRWSFANGQTITQAWNGSYTQSGANVSVTNQSHNASIPAGGSQGFGFTANTGSTNSAPTAFTVNGAPCGGSNPVPTPTRTTTAVPTAQPTVGPNPTPVPGGSFVAQHGKLRVSGSKLVNKNGTPIQLKGMSSHGLQWYGQFMNQSSVSYLASNWKATVVRAAMYIDEGGYLTNRTAMKQKVKDIVQYAETAGIYVIIDWHILNPGDPNIHLAEAKAFWQEMATLYKGKQHVLYEIANEPNGVTWGSSIKPYAEQVISVIRAVDPNTVIIVGTGEWSQKVDDAAASPLAYSNIMYALHFYSGTHTQWLRDRADAAMARGIAIFVTEWGTSDASGNGGPYLSEAQAWVDWMKSRQISWANWSLSNKAESSAALTSGASTTGGWTDSNLTASGRFVRGAIQAP